MGLFSSVGSALGGLIGGGAGSFGSGSDPNRRKSLLSEGQEQIQRGLTDFFQDFFLDTPRLSDQSILASRLFNPTRHQAHFRQMNRNFDPRQTFAGSDDALSRLLSGKTDALIGFDEIHGENEARLFAPARVAQQKLLEESRKGIRSAGSAGGSRFGSQNAQVEAGLLRDLQREQTTQFASEIGRLEQTRLLANQAAKLQAEQQQGLGVQLAGLRQDAIQDRIGQAIGTEDLFRQLRQQRVQSTLPQFNPLLGSALQFALTPTQQITQVDPGGFKTSGALGGFGNVGSAIGGLFG